MVAIVVEPSRASEVILHRGDGASEGYPVSAEGYPASSLDDQGSMSRSRITTLQDLRQIRATAGQTRICFT